MGNVKGTIGKITFFICLSLFISGLANGLVDFLDETSENIITESKIDAVFLTTTVNYPDSVVASAAAYEMGVPVIPTKDTELTDVVKNAIIDFSPETIYIVGGPAVISDSVQEELETLTSDVVRIWGTTKFGTASKISTYFWANTGAKDVILVCDTIGSKGDEYKQLAASLSLTRLYNAPILLTSCEKLSSEAASSISELNASNIYLVGTNPGGNLTSQIENLGVSLTMLSGTNLDETLDNVISHIKTNIDAQQFSEVIVVATENNFEDILKFPTDEGNSLFFILSDIEKADSIVNFIKDFEIDTYSVVGDPDITKKILEKFGEEEIQTEGIETITEEDPTLAATKKLKEIKDKFVEKNKDYIEALKNIESQLKSIEMQKRALEQYTNAEAVVLDTELLVEDYKNDVARDENAAQKASKLISKAKTLLEDASKSIDNEEYVKAYKQSRQAEDVAGEAEWLIISTLDQTSRIEKIMKKVEQELNTFQVELKKATDTILKLEEKVKLFEKEYGENKKLTFVLKAAKSSLKDAEFTAIEKGDIKGFKEFIQQVYAKEKQIYNLIDTLTSETEIINEDIFKRELENALKQLKREIEIKEDDDNFDSIASQFDDIYVDKITEDADFDKFWDDLNNIRDSFDNTAEQRKYRRDIDDAEEFAKDLDAQIENLDAAGYNVDLHKDLVTELRDLIDQANEALDAGEYEKIELIGEDAKVLVTRIEISFGLLHLENALNELERHLESKENDGYNGDRIRFSISHYRDTLKEISDELEASLIGEEDLLPVLMGIDRRYGRFDHGLMKFIDNAYREMEGTQLLHDFRDHLEDAAMQIEMVRTRLIELELDFFDVSFESYDALDRAEDLLFEAKIKYNKGDSEKAMELIYKAREQIDYSQTSIHLMDLLNWYKAMKDHISALSYEPSIDTNDFDSSLDEIKRKLDEATDYQKNDKIRELARLLGSINRMMDKLQRQLDEKGSIVEFKRHKEEVEFQLEDLEYRASYLEGLDKTAFDQLYSSVQSDLKKAIEYASNGNRRGAEKSFEKIWNKLPILHYMLEKHEAIQHLENLEFELEIMEEEGFVSHKFKLKVEDTKDCYETLIKDFDANDDHRRLEYAFRKCRHMADNLRQEFEHFQNWKNFQHTLDKADQTIEEIDYHLGEAEINGFELPKEIYLLRDEFESIVSKVKTLFKEGKYDLAWRHMDKGWRVAERVHLLGRFVEINIRLNEIQKHIDNTRYDDAGDISSSIQDDLDELRDDIEDIKLEIAELPPHHAHRALDNVFRRIEMFEKKFYSNERISNLKEWIYRIKEDIENIKYEANYDDKTFDRLLLEAELLEEELNNLIDQIGGLDGQRYERLISRFEKDLHEFDAKKNVITGIFWMNKRFDDMQRRLEDMEYDSIDTSQGMRELSRLRDKLHDLKEDLKDIPGDRIHRVFDKFNKEIDTFEHEYFQKMEAKRAFKEAQRQLDEVRDEIDNIKYDNENIDINDIEDDYERLLEYYDEVKEKLTSSDQFDGRYMDRFWKRLEEFRHGLWNRMRFQHYNNEIENMLQTLDDMSYNHDYEVPISVKKEISDIQYEIRKLEDEAPDMDHRASERAFKDLDRKTELLRMSVYGNQRLFWLEQRLSGIEEQFERMQDDGFEVSIDRSKINYFNKLIENVKSLMKDYTGGDTRKVDRAFENAEREMDQFSHSSGALERLSHSKRNLENRKEDWDYQNEDHPENYVDYDEDEWDRLMKGVEELMEKASSHLERDLNREIDRLENEINQYTGNVDRLRWIGWKKMEIKEMRRQIDEYKDKDMPYESLENWADRLENMLDNLSERVTDIDHREFEREQKDIDKTFQKTWQDFRLFGVKLWRGNHIEGLKNGIEDLKAHNKDTEEIERKIAELEAKHNNWVEELENLKGNNNFDRTAEKQDREWDTLSQELNRLFEDAWHQDSDNTYDNNDDNNNNEGSQFCLVDGDCSNGMICATDKQECVSDDNLTGDFCLVDSDCDSGGFCDTDLQQCVYDEEEPKEISEIEITVEPEVTIEVEMQ